MFVTSGTREQQDLLEEVVAGLGAIGVAAVAEAGSLVVDGRQVPVRLLARAHPTPADIVQLTGDTAVDSTEDSAEDSAVDSADDSAVVLVADRISEPGRDALRRAGWGWLDRRGHVRLWAPGVRVEAPLPSEAGPRRSRSANPWTEVGLEIAVAALLRPADPVTARRVAPVIGRSVGAVHELIARFTELGLVGPQTRRPLLPELFWEAAARWPDDGWLPLPVELAVLAERVGGDELLRVDERAATLAGARIAAVGDLPARCYVRSGTAWRRARSLFEGDAATRCWVRRPPVRWLPENDDHPPDAAHPWRLGHPIVCALRLAADPARGREIVEDWGVVPGGET